MESIATNQSLTNQSRNMTVTREAKKGHATPTVPVFLQKTYELIDTCAPNIASWSPDGLTFVVKDPQKFQFEHIPKYFKHNNFSSFVRQLNFYGFHKVKADPLRIEEAETSEESKYWKFHHEKFQRGRPDFLSEIRKTNRIEAAEKQEVESLKYEVVGLRNQVSGMKDDIDSLKAKVSGLLQGQHSNQHVYHAPNEIPSKRMKFNHDNKVNPFIVLSYDDPRLAVTLQSDPNIEKKFSLPAPARPAPQGFGTGGGRVSSIGLCSFSPQDEALLSNLFPLDKPATTM